MVCLVAFDLIILYSAKWIVLTLSPNGNSFLHCQIQRSLGISLKACLWDTSSDVPELLRTSPDRLLWPGTLAKAAVYRNMKVNMRFQASLFLSRNFHW